MKKPELIKIIKEEVNKILQEQIPFSHADKKGPKFYNTPDPVYEAKKVVEAIILAHKKGRYFLSDEEYPDLSSQGKYDETDASRVQMGSALSTFLTEFKKLIDAKIKLSNRPVHTKITALIDKAMVHTSGGE